MEIKKIMSILISALVVLLVPASLFAEDLNTTADAEVTVTATDDGINTSVEVDETDLVLLSDIDGAKLRLLQLEEAISAQVVGGETIIENLINDNVSEDIISELEDILASLNEIAADINSTNYEDSLETISADYLSYKAQAMELTSEFKDIVHSTLDTEKIFELKKQYEEKKQERLKQQKQNGKIKELVNKVNSKNVEKRLKELGKYDEELVKQIQNGQVNMNQIKEKLVQEYNSLNESQRNQVKQRLNEEYKKLSIENKQRVDKIKKDIEEFQKSRNMKQEEFLKKIRDIRKNFSKEDIEKAKKYIKENNLTAEDIEKIKNQYQEKIMNVNKYQKNTEENDSELKEDDELDEIESNVEVGVNSSEEMITMR